jgi:hypothetical protein
VSGEASEVGVSTVAVPSGEARMRRPRVARGRAGTRHGRGLASARRWRVSRPWSRGLTRLGQAPCSDRARQCHTPAWRMARRAHVCAGSQQPRLFLFCLPEFKIVKHNIID